MNNNVVNLDSFRTTPPPIVKRLFRFGFAQIYTAEGHSTVVSQHHMVSSDLNFLLTTAQHIVEEKHSSMPRAAYLNTVALAGEIFTAERFTTEGRCAISIPDKEPTTSFELEIERVEQNNWFTHSIT